MSEKAGNAEQRRTPLAVAQEVREKYEAELLSKANVIGVGVGLVHKQGDATGEVGVIVMVANKVPNADLAPDDRVPSVLDGVRIDVQQVGSLAAG